MSSHRQNYDASKDHHQSLHVLYACGQLGKRHSLPCADVKFAAVFARVKPKEKRHVD